MRSHADGRLGGTLSRAKEGQEDALEELLARLHPILLRYASSQLRPAPDVDALAQDLVQEALIRIARSLGQCQATTDGPILTWALTIIKNICIDHFRSRRAKAVPVRITPVLEQVLGELALHAWTEGKANRGRQVVHRILREAVRALPRPARRLLRLRVLQELSWSEIGRELGISRVAAKSRFRRIRNALRAEALRRMERLEEGDRATALRFLERQYR
jgi:RNA polymerase sigma-70 factor (ECF subfamily)